MEHFHSDRGDWKQFISGYAATATANLHRCMQLLGVMLMGLSYPRV